MTETPDVHSDEAHPMTGASQRFGLWLGPVLFAIAMLFLGQTGMPATAVPVAAVTLWVAAWWITEPIPIPASSLLPIVLLPLVAGIKPEAAASGYANPTIFVFIGGFMLALALEKWGLHRRIALHTIALIGTSPARIVLGVMTATAGLSMWLNNTATAMLMLPTGTAIIAQLDRVSKQPHEAGEAGPPLDLVSFGTALMLGIAYASSIGGLGTLVGTMPNIVLAAAAEKLLGIEITFLSWLMIGLPTVVIGILGTWLYLTRIGYAVERRPIAGSLTVLRGEIAKLGPMRPAEKRLLLIFGLVAAGWILQPFLIKPWLPLVDDAVIAVAGATALFLIPAKAKGARLLDWETAVKLPWGVILLFGGGLAIADAFQSSGLSAWMGEVMVAFRVLPPIVILLAVVTLVVALTEIASNTATATLMMPVMAALGAGVGLPGLLLMIPAALAASCGFMMPAGTPPNAIAYASGQITMRDMVRAGFWLDLGSIVVLTALGYWLVPLIW